MTLFNNKSMRPLAVRMRPRCFSEFLGQRHILSSGGIIEQIIKSDIFPSLILYGPPGTGKTSLALLLAREKQMKFVYLNAAVSNVKELRTVLFSARERFNKTGLRTMLFIDEIQRFNASQQEVLLPFVEEGSSIFVGASVENPLFVLIPALNSRCLVIELKRLSDQEVFTGLKRALQDKERGFARDIKVDDPVLWSIAKRSDGDMRRAYTMLEILCAGKDKITVQDLERLTGRKVLYYDRASDMHYDTISSFIKAMRRGDEQEATYWLSKMLYAGEDPRFIVRRMIIFASEDIGMADPNALVVAVSSYHALQVVGLPEAEFVLMQACMYLSRAPKSQETKERLFALKEQIEKEQSKVPKKFVQPKLPK